MSKRTAPVLIRRAGRNMPPRDYARQHAEQAVSLLAHAFNHCENPDLPYRYGKAVQSQLQEIVSRIVELIEGGQIVELAHIAAKADEPFQAFMLNAKFGIARPVPASGKRTRRAQR